MTTGSPLCATMLTARREKYAGHLAHLGAGKSIPRDAATSDFVADKKRNTRHLPAWKQHEYTHYPFL